MGGRWQRVSGLLGASDGWRARQEVAPLAAGEHHQTCASARKHDENPGLLTTNTSTPSAPQLLYHPLATPPSAALAPATNGFGVLGDHSRTLLAALRAEAGDAGGASESNDALDTDRGVAANEKTPPSAAGVRSPPLSAGLPPNDASDVGTLITVPRRVLPRRMDNDRPGVGAARGLWLPPSRSSEDLLCWETCRSVAGLRWGM